ncbi:hypothetical protein BLA29_000267 [Euroglyphus maynei]|uniref:Uncharacterized protein n=1 Tax=Euroglyphus maynei TaxID=6958 RepID=A0A1Y3BBU1_EURMA|nr:hypothetical protein BLA29_000267 [Euroglyphus maynei]
MSILVFGHNRSLSMWMAMVVFISIFWLPDSSSLQTTQPMKAWGGVRNASQTDANDDDNTDGSSDLNNNSSVANASQPFALNGTIPGPHLVVSGRLVKPSHHSLLTTQMRGPSVYYGTPLVHLLAKEEEIEEEYEEVKAPKKLLGKLGGKKGDGKKVLALPVQESEYEEQVPVVEVKPAKKLKIKKPKVKPVAVAVDDGYDALPVATVMTPGYGAAAKPLLSAGYAPSPPSLAYPGHYRIDSQPNGKFIPHFRQDASDGGAIISANDSQSNSNSTVVESRATLTGIRSVPTYGSQVIPGYLATGQSYLNARNATTTNVDERNKYNVYSAGVPQASLNFNAYAAPYSPAPTAGYPVASPTYAAAAPATPAAAPALSYPKVLSTVLGYYPATSGAYPTNYTQQQYDYSMPVAVVNVFCSDPHYPCSCTIYLTEINSYNMLISGVCSGLPKNSKFMMNLYPSGDITAGCNALGHSLAGYRSPAAIQLGSIKSDYHGVAFVNKLKHASIGVTCDKYGYKDSILGRAVGLVEMAIPVPAAYRRTLAGYAAQLPSAGYGGAAPLHLALAPSKIAACGVIGLAGKDNSYETRELKSKLIANARHEE